MKRKKSLEGSFFSSLNSIFLYYAFNFSTRSLSKYNTTFLFVVIAFASARKRREVPCYMFDLCVDAAKVN